MERITFTVSVVNVVGYILDHANNVVPVSNFLQWAIWFETHSKECVVSKTMMPDGVEISTVFIGLDTTGNRAHPLVFETMIFGGEYDHKQKRYATWQEALEGHTNAIKFHLELLMRDTKEE